MRGATYLALLPVALLALAAAGCAAAPAPESTAEREVAATAAAAAASEAEESDRRAREEAQRAPEPVRDKIVVVDRGGGARQPTPGELAAAARRERAEHGDRSVAALTDENLADYAARGTVTVSGEPVAEAGAEGEDAADGDAASEGDAAAVAAGEDAATAEAAEAADDAPCDEVCWRRRVRELRLAWRDTVDSIDELEAEVAEQRWRFYATDDPWVRDSQVKPAWDRALDRLRAARDEAERYAERVGELVDEGRRAGALPGWLREGIDLEPQAEAAPAAGRDPAEPGEPTMADEESREPRPQRRPPRD